MASRLLVRGPNVMAGYLRPEGGGRIEPPEDGWYDTGDIVRMGEEGHVVIVGRAKRFAKVGGEMVSLAAVEALAAEVWPGEPLGAAALACPRKGQKVVLAIANPAAGLDALRARAREAGVAEIQLPSELRILAEIPVMASGKTDFPRLQALLEAEPADHRLGGRRAWMRGDLEPNIAGDDGRGVDIGEQQALAASLLSRSSASLSWTLCSSAKSPRDWHAAVQPLVASLGRPFGILPARRRRLIPRGYRPRAIRGNPRQRVLRTDRHHTPGRRAHAHRGASSSPQLPAPSLGRRRIRFRARGAKTHRKARGRPCGSAWDKLGPRPSP